MKLKIKKHSINKLSLSILVIFSLVAGCSTHSPEKSTDNITAFKQNRHITLKTTAQFTSNPSDDLEDITDNNLWSHVRNGFQLKQEYLIKNDRIAKQKRLFIAKSASTKQVLEQSAPYLYYIVKQLDKRNMPLELAFLPAVESSYNPFAVSNQNAAGLWQFMPATAKNFNLKRNAHYDARLDIIASTNAALDYLQYLHKMFNDWPLALAAYNAGEGTILKAIAKNKQRHLPTDYWNLALPKQTHEYVAKLFALSEIILTADKYSLNLKTINNEPYFTIVNINNQTKLSTIATLINIPKNQLTKLNPGFKQRSITHQAPQRILVPHKKAKQLLHLVATNSIPNENNNQQHHAYSTKINQKSNLNRSTIKTKASTITTNQLKKTYTSIPRKKYTIKQGDNLWQISQQNKIDLKKLLTLNNLTERSSIKPGQKLLISDID